MKALKVFILLLLIPAVLWARVPDNELIPLNNQRVIDQTGVLQSDEKSQLTTLSEEIEQKTGAQYVIVLVKTTSPYTIEDYAFSLGEFWGLGTEKADNGLIMLIALQDKKMRIEVGYGLEGVVPDALGKRIIETQLKPNFRNQDFYKGIYAGSTTIKELIFKEPVSDKNFKKEKDESNFYLWFIFPLLILIFLITNSKNGNNHGGGHYHGGYSGGFGGSSRGGSFGGSRGGFSGGGGSFGGGGASGGW